MVCNKQIHYFVHHRPGRSPGQRFRCEQYLPYLREGGFQTRWHNLLDEAGDRVFYSRGNIFRKIRLVIQTWFQRQKEVRRVKKGDIAFVYREAFMLGTTYFERKLKKKGARVVFDFDDAIWLKDVSEGNKRFAFLKRPGKTAEIITMSDLVICGNAWLADYARRYNSEVVIMPTTIDTDYHKPRSGSKRNQKICIGWTGSETTIRHFETILPVLEKLSTKYRDRICFKLISNKPVEYPSLSLVSTIWKKEEEVSQLKEFDIGIMPLPDEEWSKGKCGFKILQYMAMGIPAVASPVGVNKQIIEEGVNGYLADDEETWIDALSKLIEDSSKRAQMGNAGREKVEKEYSAQSQKARYLQLFTGLRAS